MARRGFGDFGFSSPLDIGITLPGNIPVLGGTRIDIGTGGGATVPSGSPVVPTNLTVPGGGRNGCLPFMCPDPVTGNCVPCFGEDVGRDVGEGIHRGDHMPGVETVDVRRCLPGHVLGKDLICHEKGDIPNRKRLYPKPRRPLGTSGDLNAVTRASRFGMRLKSNEKRLKRLGRNLGVAARRGR